MQNSPQPVLSHENIESKIHSCPQLASLKQLKSSLNSLVNADQTYTSQIADVIRRDPSLTTRLLKLVNSAFFGLSQRITSIEDAVFYLGLKRIRELSISTPIIDDLQALKISNTQVNWQHLWTHSLGVAIMTRELISAAKVQVEGECDYIAGLVHNIGKVVFASTFPSIFNTVCNQSASTPEAFASIERDFLGWDHARIGASYLRKHQLPDSVVEATEFHHSPEEAPHVPQLAAAIQIADTLTRFIGIQSIEKVDTVARDSWKSMPAWNMLFNEETPLDPFTESTLHQKLDQLPMLVHGMA